MVTRFRGLISRQDGQDSSRLFYCFRACFSRAPLYWALLRCLYFLICCVIQEPLLSLFCFSESSSMVRWTHNPTTPPHCSRAWNRFQANILSKSPRRVKASRTFKTLFFFPKLKIFQDMHEAHETHEIHETHETHETRAGLKLKIAFVRPGTKDPQLLDFRPQKE